LRQAVEEEVHFLEKEVFDMQRDTDTRKAEEKDFAFFVTYKESSFGKGKKLIHPFLLYTNVKGIVQRCSGELTLPVFQSGLLKSV
jgi:hypothetical protein